MHTSYWSENKWNKLEVKVPNIFYLLKMNGLNPGKLKKILDRWTSALLNPPAIQHSQSSPFHYIWDELLLISWQIQMCSNDFDFFNFPGLGPFISSKSKKFL